MSEFILFYWALEFFNGQKNGIYQLAKFWYILYNGQEKNFFAIFWKTIFKVIYNYICCDLKYTQRRVQVAIFLFSYFNNTVIFVTVVLTIYVLLFIYYNVFFVCSIL